VIAAVHDPRSIGVHRYVERLSAAMAELTVDYRPASRPHEGEFAHFHLANSTRAIMPGVVRHGRPFLLTVHDVIPRTAALRPLHRAFVAPLCIRRAARVIVHSRHAAELLARTAAVADARVAVVPHPAPRPRNTERAAARAALGIDLDGPPLFVLPGVLKGAKLVRETLRAAAPLLATGRARLLLAGRVVDERLAAEAARAGAVLLRDPEAESYEQAIVAADAVLCVRADSVGESSGPLLDAIGAGRPSIVTAVGAAPETAGESARVAEPNVEGIRRGIEALLDEGERGSRADAARRRAAELTWAAAARCHVELLGEAADG
jgi:glycosyltransferase involved in cell wall biosynthesis